MTAATDPQSFVTEPSAGARALDALEHELNDMSARVSLANDVRFLAQLADLDRGLAGDDGLAAELHPPLEAMLVLPGPLQDEGQPLPKHRPAVLVSTTPPGDRINAWIFSVTLVLLMLLGGAAAVLVFHERVSQIALQLEISL